MPDYSWSTGNSECAGLNRYVVVLEAAMIGTTGTETEFDFN